MKLSLKSFLFTAVIFLGVFAFNATHVSAAVCTAESTGLWSADATWDAACNGAGNIPGAGDSVVIPAGFTVTVDSDFSVTSVTVQGNDDAGITIGGTNTLTVSGSVTMAVPIDGVTNTIAVGAGTLVVGGDLVINSGGSVNEISIVSVSTGTINVEGNIALQGATTSATRLISTGSSTIFVGGDVTSGGSVTLGTSTVTFDGSGAQMIGGYAYYNVTINKSAGTVTLGDNGLILGALIIIEGEFSTSTHNIDITQATLIEDGGTLTHGTGTKVHNGNVTVTEGGTWTETDAAVVTYLGHLTNNGTFTASTGVHTFGIDVRSINGTVSIPNLTISGSTTNNGTLTVSTALAGASTLINSATGILNIGGTSTIVGLVATAVGNQVHYTGTDQTVKATNYANLFLEGTGIKTIASAITIADALSIDDGVSTALTGDSTTDSLLLDGNLMVAGSWGSTDSNATNKNNVYFSGTGMVITGILGSGTEQDPYQLNRCYTIVQSGYYILTGDIESIDQDCIVIEAHDVSINGDEHAITGNGSDHETQYQAISTEGYDRISIQDIILGGFYAGIQLRDSEGPSFISGVTVSDMFDSGIEGLGVTNITITGNTISNISDDGISIGSYIEETEIESSGVTISNNTISEIDDDGIDISYSSDVLITGNLLSDIDSDGIYAEEINELIVSDNIISDTGADGIDISDDGDGNTDITIINNTLTNIGDNGIELDEVYGATITGNAMEILGDGIAVDDSEDIEFNNNTITPKRTDYFVIPGNEFNFLDLDIIDAASSTNGDDESFTYTLPFTFNFMGRDITDLEISTNGSIELLIDGEGCEICSEYGSYSSYLDNDVIFSSFDDLITTDNDGHVAVFYLDDEDGERVVIEFYGENILDGNDLEDNLIHFQTILYPNGTVEWNFNEMLFVNHGFDMFTGVYDFEAGEIYQAGKLINGEGVGYAGDFSGNAEFGEPIEDYASNIGLDLDEVINSTFIGNSIQASQWVFGVDLENVLFNDNDSGNTYYLLNGDGAWTIFDITDSTGNGFADTGTNRPFNEAMLGVQYWEGEGQDAYPATENEITVVATRRSSGNSISNQIKNLKEMGKIEESEKLENKFNNFLNKKTPTVQSLLKQISELQALLAKLQGQSITPTNSTPLVCSPLLKKGARGNEVLKLQKRLGVKPESGLFASITENAVKAFQTQKRIRVDGIVGPETCAMFK